MIKFSYRRLHCKKAAVLLGARSSGNAFRVQQLVVKLQREQERWQGAPMTAAEREDGRKPPVKAAVVAKAAEIEAEKAPLHEATLEENEAKLEVFAQQAKMDAEATALVKANDAAEARLADTKAENEAWDRAISQIDSRSDVELKAMQAAITAEMKARKAMTKLALAA